jgi:hypothetical protein
LLLIQSDILSVAMYPTAVKDIDYKSLDVFINRLLNRVTGCSQRFTSATFLRAELGVPSSKYLGHMRALCYAWKLANTCSFKDSLLAMHGDGPVQRVVNLMYEYELVKRSRTTVPGKAIRSTEQEKATAIAALRDVTKGQWKVMVKKAVLAVAAVKMQEELGKRGLDMSPEPLVAPRPYVCLGGYKARYGVHWRWSIMKQFHTKLRPGGGPSLQESRYEASGVLPAVRTLAEMLENDEYFPVAHSKCREDALRAVAQDLHPGLRPVEEIPSWVKPHFKASLEQLSWAGQSPQSTRCVLELFHRLTQVKTKLERRHRERIDAVNVTGAPLAVDPSQVET